jgi:hypothetical protein
MRNTVTSLRKADACKTLAVGTILRRAKELRQISIFSGP